MAEDTKQLLPATSSLESNYTRDNVSSIIDRGQSHEAQVLTPDNVEELRQLAMNSMEGDVLYDTFEQIAQGGFGVIFKTHLLAENFERIGPRVIKYVQLGMHVVQAQQDSSDENGEGNGCRIRLEREVELLRKHNDHENIVNFFRAGYEKEVNGYRVIFMEFEYCDTDLGAEIDARRNTDGGKFYYATEVLPWLRDVTSALTFMHSQNIVHRDIKPANILLKGVGDRKCAKVADFGLARYNNDEKLDCLTRIAVCLHLIVIDDESTPSGGYGIGTLPYRSPECFEFDTENPPKQANNPMRDVWALGITAFELATLKRPYDNNIPTDIWGESMHRLLYSRMITQQPEIDFDYDNFPREFCDGLIMSMLKPKLAERLSITEVERQLSLL